VGLDGVGVDDDRPVGGNAHALVAHELVRREVRLNEVTRLFFDFIHPNRVKARDVALNATSTHFRPTFRVR
jgi:hypothetical protein